MMSMQKTLSYGLHWSLAFVTHPGQAEEEGALAQLAAEADDMEIRIRRSASARSSAG
jgi:hypothetical protein